MVLVSASLLPACLPRARQQWSHGEFSRCSAAARCGGLEVRCRYQANRPSLKTDDGDDDDNDDGDDHDDRDDHDVFTLCAYVAHFP